MQKPGLKKAQLEQIRDMYAKKGDRGKECAEYLKKLPPIGQQRWQPAPEVVDIPYKETVEVKNEDLQPNQIKVKLTGSAQLQGVSADYVKYHLNYDSGNKSADFNNHFEKKEEGSKEWVHDLPKDKAP